MKGHGLLVEAAAILERRGGLAGVRIAIVGDAVQGQERLRVQLLEQVDNAGLSDRFALLPFCDDIWPVWFGTQIAVVPSTEPESFGLVAIEAMAAGVPVVAAAHGGLLDIVRDGETGLLFEPRSASALADALGRLIGDAPLRARLGEAGARRQADAFSLASQQRQTESLYREMVRAGRP